MRLNVRRLWTEVWGAVSLTRLPNLSCRSSDLKQRIAHDSTWGCQSCQAF